MANRLLISLMLLVQLHRSATTSFGGAFYYETSDDQTIPVDQELLQDNAGATVEKQMLELLGLPQKPKHLDHHLRSNAAPQFMLHLYQAIQKQEGLDVTPTATPDEENLGRELRNVSYTEEEASKLGDSDIVISFVNKVGKDKLGIENEEDRRYHFELDDIPNTAILTDAELRLYKKKSQHEEENYFITVFKIGPAPQSDDFSLSILDSLMVSSSFEGWLLFNVTEAMEQWLSNKTGSTNNGLYVQVMSTSGEEILPHRIGIVNRHGEAAKQGFMVAFFWSEVPLTPSLPNMRDVMERGEMNRRQKRSTQWTPSYYWNPPDERKMSRKDCQRRRLLVNFERISLDDWIIAPVDFEAFYCEGECSFPLYAHMNATNHAIIQTLVSLIHPKKFPKACCAPKTLSDINILFFDEKYNVVMKKYRKMVVQSCGCH